MTYASIGETFEKKLAGTLGDYPLKTDNNGGIMFKLFTKKTVPDEQLLQMIQAIYLSCIGLELLGLTANIQMVKGSNQVLNLMLADLLDTYSKRHPNADTLEILTGLREKLEKEGDYHAKRTQTTVSGERSGAGITEINPDHLRSRHDLSE